MQVPSKYVDGYTDAINSVVQHSKGELIAALSMVDTTADPADLRRVLIQLMEDFCSAYSQVGARVSADFYNQLRAEVTGKGADALTLNDGRNPASTRKAVLRLLRMFEEEELEWDEVVEQLQEQVEVEIKRGAAFNTVDNVRQDDGDVRYARVPQGEKTCDFCIMLASRGPIYWSEESAGEFTKFHPSCDCKVVPFFGTYEDGDSRRASPMTIEGYDPDALYDEYLATRKRKAEWHRKHDHK
jgi:hypothetical protein